LETLRVGASRALAVACVDVGPTRSRGNPRTLTTLRAKLIKIGAKVVRHAKAVTFQLVEVAVPRVLFAAILG
jgi:hypothetical protein